MKSSASLPWDSQFLNRSPTFAPLRPAGHCLERRTDWPDRNLLGELLTARGVVSGGGQPLRPAPSLSSDDARSDYESRCFLTGELETREKNWHDLFNALVWLTFPRAKAGINTRHYHALQASPAPNGRGPERDCLTLFDECGVIVASDDEALLDLIRGFSWKELFWRRREDMLARMRVYLFGHGLYEQALRPHIGLTGKAVLLAVEPSFLEAPLDWQLRHVDSEIATLLASPEKFKQSKELSPFPILGVPDWTQETAEERFYDNTDYFRPGRQGKKTTQVSDKTPWR